MSEGKGSILDPRGVWWGWPSTEVGFHPTILTFGRMSKLFLLSLNRMVGFHPTILTFGRMSKLFLLSLNRMV